LLAPIIDLLTLYGLLFLNRSETALAWLAMLGMQLLTAVVAFKLDREKLGPLWTLPLQQFAYRQLMYLVLIQSGLTALTGARLRWHKLRRAGTAAATAPAGLVAPVAAVAAPTRRPEPTPGAPEPTRPELPKPRGEAVAAARGRARVPVNPSSDTPPQRDQDFLLPSKRGILP
jgi:hypothetical protein